MFIVVSDSTCLRLDLSIIFWFSLFLDKPLNSEKERLKCGRCKNTYATRQSLKYHMHASHTNKPVCIFACHFCPKEFSQMNFLKSHLRKHEKKPFYACDICGKTERTRAYILRHVVIHRKEQLYQCDLCPKSFKTRKYIVRHVMTHFRKLKHKSLVQEITKSFYYTFYIFQ
jgi:uncharacterized Zn-finger protein